MSRPTVKSAHQRKSKRAEAGDVLTLAEAARYLRLSGTEVARLAQEGKIPSRQIGMEWRFLKSALQEWLRGVPRSSKDVFLESAGIWKDDPTVPGMLEEIYRQRGRPMGGQG